MAPENSVCAQSKTLEKFGIEIMVENNQEKYRVNWWQQEGANKNEYYLLIPCDVKNGTGKLYFTGSEIISIDGEKYVNGQQINILSEGIHEIECAGMKYHLFVLRGSNIPIIQIDTMSGTLDNIYADKTYREPGKIKIISGKEMIYTGELEYIKGRGNYTWLLDKKPFNIKFTEKVNLFHIGKAKKWTLLANYIDPTNIKNKLGLDYAEYVNIPYSPESVFVDVYINDEYMGNYTLTERVEIDENRVGITNLEKINEQGNPGIITGGYLLEFELPERYSGEEKGFVSDYGQPILVKSPENITEEQLSYIKNYYQEFENAVLNDEGYNEKGRHYSEYLDVQSMAKMYVFQEYIKNLDAAIASFYLYKDITGKLIAGPVWDLDSAFGRIHERNGVLLQDPIGEWVGNGILRDKSSEVEKNTIIALLCKHDEFKLLASKEWNNIFRTSIHPLLQYVDKLHGENGESIIADKIRWLPGNSYSAAQAQLNQSISTLKEFLEVRSEFMNSLFTEEKCEKTLLEQLLNAFSEYMQKIMGDKM